MLQARHFEAFARIVRNIREGKWTNELPDWADAIPHEFELGIPATFETDSEYGNQDTNLIRAIWTAEVFIILSQQSNPLFNLERFLDACGLVPRTTPKRKVRAKGSTVTP